MVSSDRENKMLNNKYYVHGIQKCPLPLHLNFGKYVLDHVKNIENKIAIQNMDTKEALSYKEFTQYAVNLSVHLTKLGVKRGDVVALGTEKRNEFIPIILAIVLTGATYTPFEVQAGKACLKHKISVAKPKYLVHSKLFWEKNKDILENEKCIEHFINYDTLNSLPQIDVHLFEPAAVIGQTDVAFILYSSGTTGLPKGVQLTHLNCLIGSNPIDFEDEDLKTGYINGEWYHNYDVFMTFKFMLYGRKMVYGQNHDMRAVLKSISEFQANIVFVLPSHVTLISKEADLDKYNVNSLKIIYSRSSPLHKKTIEKVKQRFPNLKKLLQGYGMTEAGEPTSESWGHKGPKPGSVGKASPGITLKVSDVQTRKTVGPNERGEICLKGPILMKGYVGMDPSNYTDEEGFFKTGDLGYYDEDQYFYIDGRLKEIIVYDGLKLSPLECETILQMHPDVLEAGVAGRPVPVYGELPTAFVIKKPGSKVTEQELLEYFAEQVPPYSQLRGGIYFVDVLPKNPRGKILRTQLKERLIAMDSETK